MSEPKQSYDKSFQSEPSASQPKYPWHMMRDMMREMKPMFLMMMIMMVIMAGVFIYIIFFSDIELPFRN